MYICIFFGGIVIIMIIKFPWQLACRLSVFLETCWLVLMIVAFVFVVVAAAILCIFAFYMKKSNVPHKNITISKTTTPKYVEHLLDEEIYHETRRKSGKEWRKGGGGVKIVGIQLVTCFDGKQTLQVVLLSMFVGCFLDVVVVVVVLCSSATLSFCYWSHCLDLYTLHQNRGRVIWAGFKSKLWKELFDVFTYFPELVIITEVKGKYVFFSWRWTRHPSIFHQVPLNQCRLQVLIWEFYVRYGKNVTKGSKRT